MLNVDERLKELYRADSTDKQLILDFYHKGEDEPYRLNYPLKVAALILKAIALAGRPPILP